LRREVFAVDHLGMLGSQMLLIVISISKIISLGA
jgi:hypothetical protein